MRQKLHCLILCGAWLLANGSHWDLVQTFAWGKMFATYARTMSYADAARLTFSVDGLCGLCEVVQTARTDADPTEAPAPFDASAKSKTIVLALSVPPPLCLRPPVSPHWPLSDLRAPECDATPPPLPPPRVLS